MKAWAAQNVSGATNEVDKAKRLFQALAPGVKFGTDLASLTAQQAFEEMNGRNSGMKCQDYTFLYVALARSVGLNAYVVDVEKDYTGAGVSHACAGIIIDGKGLLVDLVYRWFGIEHKEFEFLDDARAVGFFLCQLGSPRQISLGIKLTTGWSVPRFEVAVALLNSGHWAQAHELLLSGLELDKNSWRAYLAKGAFDLAKKKWGDAIVNLQHCVGINAGDQTAHYLLACALYGAEKLHEARDEFRICTHGGPNAQWTSKATEAIAEITEALKRSD